MSGLRPAVRLARREVRRRPGRTALVATLVALPVAAMVMALVLLRTDDRWSSADAEWQRQFGDADAVVFPAEPGSTEIPAGLLPAGSRTTVSESMWLRARTVAGHRSQLPVTGLDPTDPLVDDQFDLLAGRFPTSGDEIALGPVVADDLGVGVGDRLSLARPEIELDVVGLVEDPAALREPVALVAPGGDLLDSDPRQSASAATLVDLPPGATIDRSRLAGPDDPANPGPDVRLRSDERLQWSGDGERMIPWTYVLGALALTVVGIVIAAAFAAGARRQLVTLGQLSANGAPGPVLRATLVAQGTVTGAVGGLAGLALAAGGLAAGRSRLEHLMGHRLGAYEVRPLEIGGAVVVGVAAATVAALVPAWSITRIPTLAALAGRRPLGPVRHRVTASGALAAVVGLALLGLAVLGSASGNDGTTWALVAIAGGVLELLGACAVAPAVVARLEPLAGRTRGAWRLAARSLARQRGRTGAVVSAVAAAVGLAVAATALVAGGAAAGERRPSLAGDVVVATEVTVAPPDEAMPETRDAFAVPGPPVQEELEQIVPRATKVTLRTAGTAEDWPDLPLPVVADDEVLDAFRFGATVRQALDDTGLVTIGRAGGRHLRPDGRVLVPEVVDSDRGMGPEWHLLVSPQMVDELGLEPRDAGLVYVAGGPLTDDQNDALDDLRTDWQFDQPASEPGWLALHARWHEPGPTPVQVEVVLTGLAVVFAVLVVGASLALAAAEARDERDTLTVAGAGPGTLARVAGAKGWLLAVLGAAMAVPVGLLPVAVYTAADGGDMPFVVPWRSVGVFAVVLPVAVGVVALAASAAAQRLRPVRVSTAVFD